MTRRNLILIHRGPEYERDFDEIAAKVNARDSDITVYHLPAGLKAELPLTAWQFPTLTVALVSKFRLPIRRGPILRNVEIGKLAQTEVLRAFGVPTPPTLPFRFGMKLDPIMFGDFVLLKPLNLHLTSHGHGIHVMRRVRAETIRPSEFSADHPIRHGNAFAVQRFIYTGKNASTHRVTTFLGEILFSTKFESDIVSPDLSSPDHIIDAGKFTHKGDFAVSFEADDEILALARQVAIAFKEIPLLGIDLVKDCRSSKVYVLEVNAGGNVWHFSSKLWEERRRKKPELTQLMKEQFSAFDLVARVLTDETRRSAS